MLRIWSNSLADSEFKYDVKPSCCQPYPVIKAHEAMFKKNIKWLAALVILECSNDTEWEAP